MLSIGLHIPGICFQEEKCRFRARQLHSWAQAPLRGHSQHLEDACPQLSDSTSCSDQQRGAALQLGLGSSMFSELLRAAMWQSGSLITERGPGTTTDTHIYRLPGAVICLPTHVPSAVNKQPWCQTLYSSPWPDLAPTGHSIPIPGLPRMPSSVLHPRRGKEKCLIEEGKHLSASQGSIK